VSSERFSTGAWFGFREREGRLLDAASAASLRTCDGDYRVNRDKKPAPGLRFPFQSPPDPL
jgi:hypothetical protein